MPVLIEGYSVVIRIDAIQRHFPGGWKYFQEAIPNATLVNDSEIARVGFLSAGHAERYVQQLERDDLVHLQDGQAQHMVVVEQFRGMMSRCEWLEMGHMPLAIEGNPNVVACRLVGSESEQLMTPIGWKFEGSLSASTGNGPSPDQLGEDYVFQGYHSGARVYLNKKTGEKFLLVEQQKHKAE